MKLYPSTTLDSWLYGQEGANMLSFDEDPHEMRDPLRRHPDLVAATQEEPEEVPVLSKGDTYLMVHGPYLMAA